MVFESIVVTMETFHFSINAMMTYHHFYDDSHYIYDAQHFSDVNRNKYDDNRHFSDVNHNFNDFTISCYILRDANPHPAS